MKRYSMVCRGPRRRSLRRQRPCRTPRARHVGPRGAGEGLPEQRHVEPFWRFNFYDAGSFELARSGGFNPRLEAGESYDFNGTLTLDELTTIEAANEVDKMRIVGTIFEPVAHTRRGGRGMIARERAGELLELAE